MTPRRALLWLGTLAVLLLVGAVWLLQPAPLPGLPLLVLALILFAVWVAIARLGAVAAGLVSAERHVAALAAELARARAASADAAAVKRRFLAAVGHELRTPLTTIIGMTRLALVTDLDARQRDYLNRADGAAHQLLAQIDQILAAARSEPAGAACVTDGLAPGRDAPTAVGLTPFDGVPAQAGPLARRTVDPGTEPAAEAAAGLVMEPATVMATKRATDRAHGRTAPSRSEADTPRLQRRLRRFVATYSGFVGDYRALHAGGDRVAAAALASELARAADDLGAGPLAATAAALARMRRADDDPTPLLAQAAERLAPVIVAVADELHPDRRPAREVPGARRVSGDNVIVLRPGGDDDALRQGLRQLARLLLDSDTAAIDAFERLLPRLAQPAVRDLGDALRNDLHGFDFRGALARLRRLAARLDLDLGPLAPPLDTAPRGLGASPDRARHGPP